MSVRVVTWGADMHPIGPSVVAIGVFDGVHVGHQALLHDAVGEARRHLATSVAVTFDRDPDQVVTPDSAAPQLLTLEDKCAFIGESGIDTVVVVPFTPELANTPAEQFLDTVLGTCCEVRAIHVGADFRFGRRALGDIDTLYVWAAERGAEVRPHKLVRIEGDVVTSTRIRGLVAAGEVAEAQLLLGRPTRVSGAVHEGRKQGRELGFPTANVVPVGYAALPAPGVYAGSAVLTDGSEWPAAISVGVPPSFPEARDYLEAHLVGFDGDLYGQNVSLLFVDRLREQRAYASLPELVAAITADVDAVRATIGEGPLAGSAAEEDLLRAEWVSDADLIEDPDALAAAEAAVAAVDPLDQFDGTTEPWVELLPASRLSGLWATAGVNAVALVAPLVVAGIPYAWDPYPPEQSPGYRPFYGGLDRPFTLMVPESMRTRALRVMDIDEAALSAETTSPSFPPVAPPAPGPIVTEGDTRRRILVAVFAILFFLFVVWGFVLPRFS